MQRHHFEHCKQKPQTATQNAVEAIAETVGA